MLCSLSRLGLAFHSDQAVIPVTCKDLLTLNNSTELAIYVPFPVILQDYLIDSDLIDSATCQFYCPGELTPGINISILGVTVMDAITMVLITEPKALDAKVVGWDHNLGQIPSCRRPLTA